MQPDALCVWLFLYCLPMSHVSALHAPATLGFRHGLHQATQTILFRLGPVAANINWRWLDDWLDTHFEITPQPDPDRATSPTARLDARHWAWRLLLLAAKLQQLAGIPAFDPGRILHISPAPDQDGTWQVQAAIAQVDYIASASTRRCFEAAAIVLAGLINNPDHFSQPEPLYIQLEKMLIAPLWQEHAGNHSTLSLLHAASAAGIPWRHQGQGIYQLGWGARTRHIRGGTLDTDSSIGISLAGSKDITVRWLKKAGIPVPEQLAVTNEQSALQAFTALDGTVVIKPAKSVGGQGVSLNIRRTEQVIAAYRHAAAISHPVLIERQIAGTTHHIQLVNGQMLFATKRHPVSVTGNGQQTVREQVAAENALRQRRMLWARPPLLPLDDTALACLARAGLSPDSVIPAGTEVLLRDIPTNTDGARDEDVGHLVHPDNIALARRAVRRLGLSMAGVDIISTDISVPWHENGAVINEVNHAPILGTDAISTQAIPELLKQLLNGDGRIPLEVFVGDDAAMDAALSRQTQWRQQGIACFVTDGKLTWQADGTVQTMACNGAFQRTRALLMDKRPGALLVVLNDTEWLDSGLPADRISQLHLVNDKLHEPQSGQAANSQAIAQLQALLRAHLAPAMADCDTP